MGALSSGGSKAAADATPACTPAAIVSPYAAGKVDRRRALFLALARNRSAAAFAGEPAKSIIQADKERRALNVLKRGRDLIG